MYIYICSQLLTTFLSGLRGFFKFFFVWLDSLFTLYVEVVTRYLYTNSDIRTSCAYDPLVDVYFYIVMFIIVLKYLFFKYIHYDLVDKYIYHHFQDIVIK